MLGSIDLRVTSIFPFQTAYHLCIGWLGPLLIEVVFFRHIIFLVVLSACLYVIILSTCRQTNATASAG